MKSKVYNVGEKMTKSAEKFLIEDDGFNTSERLKYDR